ncbi:MAG: thiol reductant ABC exporter subunit CydD [Anaerolineales bacterium]|nr:thiol reductant ABC exporter subunit CydD [Anaerolineales bacterium]
MHRRLLALSRSTICGLTITILTGLLIGILVVGQAWYLSLVVDGTFLGGGQPGKTNAWMLTLIFIITVRALLTWVNEISASAIAIKIKTRLRQQLLRQIIKLGPAYTRGERTGELTTTIIEATETLDAYYSQYLPQLVITTLVPASILIFVFPVDLLSGLVLMITAPLIPFFMVLIGKGAETVTKKQFEVLRLLSAHFLDSLQGLTTLKLFGQSKAHAKNIARVSNKFRDTTLSVLRITFLSALALELIATLSTAVVAVEIGLRLLYAKMTFQQAFFLLILAPEFYQPLRTLGLRFHAGMAGTTAGKRIFDILDSDVEDNQSAGEIEILPDDQHTDCLFTLNGLSYTYPGERSPVLQNLNLEIKPGQHIALVGPSGAGKSTLVQLLLGFIRPTAGKLTRVHLEKIAWVPQRPYLFHDTIAANLRIAKPEAAEEELVGAARAAYLLDFIEDLPGKFDTLIGEGGSRLSGGQAQRLAIARAFLKDAAVLIMDEPTSNLDPENEARLTASTRKLMQGRTVITIAHRLNTAANANQIIVLQNGQINQQGTHDKLLKQDGVYSQMVRRMGLAPRGNAKDPANHSPKFKPAQKHTAGEPTTLPQFSVPDTQSIFLRLLSFLRGSWRLVALSILLGSLTIGASIGLLGTSAWLISTAALHPSIAELQVAIVGVRFFGISRGIFRYLERLVSHTVTLSLIARLRVWFYQKLEPLAPARLATFHTGDILARITSDISTLESFYVRVVSPPLVALCITALTAILLGAFAPVLGLMICGLLLVPGLFSPMLTQFLNRGSGTILINARADLHSLMVDTIQGLPDLLAFDGIPTQLEKITTAETSYARSQRQASWISGLNNALGVFLTGLGAWVLLWQSIPMVLDGSLPGVVLGAIILIAQASFEAVTPLAQTAQTWSTSKRAAARVFDILDAAASRKSLIQEYSVTQSPPFIKCSRLTFAYPASSTPAVENISFELPFGKSIALVGPSGAGKSTLANLLLGFWRTFEGEFLYNDKSLVTYDPEDIRAQIAVVPQTSYFFNTSVRANLLLAWPEATPDDLYSAARKAQIHDFILSLPQGYETRLGEQGLRLSSGERQRLAIARALLKEAPILLFDEPTANLDPMVEASILETLHGLMLEKSTLLITHRLIGLEHIDEILVMENGRIRERGRHRQLIKSGGLYSHLLELQNNALLTE